MMTSIQRCMYAVLGAAILGSLALTMGGCMKPLKKLKERRGPDMPARMLSAPPIMIDSSQEVHLLVMQAPNPGWSFFTEGDEQTAEGKRIFVTIRRPDPSLMYGQVLVEKQLRTLVPSDVPLEIYARMLDFKETTRHREFVAIEPVGSFEE